MRLLVTSAHPTLQRYPQEHLGRLIQPRHYSSIEETAASGMPWAADNDAFNGGFDVDAYSKMLDRISGLPGCLFVVAPDVVGDWRATAELWASGSPDCDAAACLPHSQRRTVSPPRASLGGRSMRCSSAAPRSGR